MIAVPLCTPFSVHENKGKGLTKSEIINANDDMIQKLMIDGLTFLKKPDSDSFGIDARRLVPG